MHAPKHRLVWNLVRDLSIDNYDVFKSIDGGSSGYRETIGMVINMESGEIKMFVHSSFGCNRT